VDCGSTFFLNQRSLEVGLKLCMTPVHIIKHNLENQLPEKVLPIWKELPHVCLQNLLDWKNRLDLKTKNFAWNVWIEVENAAWNHLFMHLIGQKTLNYLQICFVEYRSCWNLENFIPTKFRLLFKSWKWQHLRNNILVHSSC